MTDTEDSQQLTSVMIINHPRTERRGLTEAAWRRQELVKLMIKIVRHPGGDAASS